jgi:transcriptional regulator with XRE-family HTH domain
MIKNAREYQITRAQAAKFERTLEEVAQTGGGEAAELEREALSSQLADLRQDLEEYDALESGRLNVVAVDDLSDLPRVLIQARISAGLSQRQLAERLALKEQQIQRYEATGYASASLARVLDVVKALGIQLRQDIALPSAVLSLDGLIKDLTSYGFDRQFLETRIIGDLDEEDESKRAWKAANAIGRMLGVPTSHVLKAEKLPLQAPLPAYKLPAHANPQKLRAYTAYAHYLAKCVLLATSLEPEAIPSHPLEVRKKIEKGFGEFTFETALRYVWSLGIAVLPLSDRGTFHGAFWRLGGKPVVVLKQHVPSNARWLIDLLHELRHAIQTAGSDAEVIEISDSPFDVRGSAKEREATQWASEVVFKGREQELAEACADEASGEIPRMKRAVRIVATREDVPVAALANYMAYRIAHQNGENWWGTATTMQPVDETPWATARDVLLEHIKLHRLESTDRELLSRALFGGDE